MRRALVALLLSASFGGTAIAAECRPDAVGTDRVIVVDPSEHGRIGTMQYAETLPLRDKEVVLTFDDGPLPPYTTRVLETLAAECVKATFFLVGRQARAFPDMVRRVYNAGHTVATHSQNHPRIFTRLSQAAAEQEIDQGIAAATAALGDPKALAPFFRFPGLGRSEAIEHYLASRGIMTWSADFPADDWTRISAEKVKARALERLERKGKGVLLLHDIQPATALALPSLLRELKSRGYRIVHVVPAGPDRPKTVTEPQSWVLSKPARQAWPRVVEPGAAARLPVPSLASFGWPHPFQPRFAPSPLVKPATVVEAQLWQKQPAAAWPPVVDVKVVALAAPTWSTPGGATAAVAPPSGPSFTVPLGVPSAEAHNLLVAPDASSPEAFASMIGPATWSGRKKPRPAPAKARVPPPVLRPPHHPVVSGHIFPPPPPRIVSRVSPSPQTSR